jgi:hypothetical protein
MKLCQPHGCRIAVYVPNLKHIERMARFNADMAKTLEGLNGMNEALINFMRVAERIGVWG